MKRRDDKRAHWYILLWISVITVVFSVTTMSLAAGAQGTRGAYTANTTGILRAIADLRREIRDVSLRIIRIEEIIAGKQKAPFKSPPNQEQAPSKDFSLNSGNLSRDEEKQLKEPGPPVEPPPSKKEAQFQICMNQCFSADKLCVTEAGTTYNSPNYGWINPVCKAFHEECTSLCVDWYYFDTPTKPPVPPLENAEQTCLLVCHAKKAACLKEAGKESQYQIQCENQYGSCKKVCPIMWEARRAL